LYSRHCQKENWRRAPQPVYSLLFGAASRHAADTQLTVIISVAIQVHGRADEYDATQKGGGQNTVSNDVHNIFFLDVQRIERVFAEWIPLRPIALLFLFGCKNIVFPWLCLFFQGNK